MAGSQSSSDKLGTGATSLGAHCVLLSCLDVAVATVLAFFAEVAL